MIKKLAKCVREYKRETVLSPLLIAGEVIMEVLIPFITASLIDKGIESADIGYTAKAGIILIVIAMISLAFGVAAGKTSAVASCGFGKNLRRDMYYKIQEYSFKNIDKFSTASLVTRLTTDVMNVQNAFGMLIRMAFRSPIMLVSSIAAAFIINPKLSLALLLFVPILGGGLFLITVKAHPTFVKVFKTYDRLNGVVEENLHGIRVVKSFVREKFEENKFKNISETIYGYFTRAEKLITFNGPLMQFCMYGCMILVSWFGAKMIVASGNDEALGMTTGQLTSYMMYIMQMLMSLMTLSMLFVTFIISRTSAQRIVEVLDEESDITSPADALTEVASGDIEFENVSFGYSEGEDKLVLKDINLKIKSGETVGIIGSTGSGKSSLVNLIPRLYDISSGKLTVGGTDVRQYDIKTLRDNVAVVLQKNVLFSGSVADNLRWGDENASNEEVEHAANVSCAHGFVSNFEAGYKTMIEQGGKNVSGGQKQRLCIARALLKKPKILILDDSTSAVDTKTDAVIRKAFREEIPGVTKLIIAQRISSVCDCDKIIVMEGGKIVGEGTHESLLETNEVYREVYTSQQKHNISEVYTSKQKGAKVSE